MLEEVFCPVHKDWYPITGGGTLPPDVLYIQSACGDKVGIHSMTRLVEHEEVTLPPAPAEPTPAAPITPIPPAPDPEEDPNAWESDENSWEHSA